MKKAQLVSLENNQALTSSRIVADKQLRKLNDLLSGQLFLPAC